MSPLALVSVSDKKNIIPFCTELVEKFNYKILSSGGTAKYLLEAKIPVIKIADFTCRDKSEIHFLPFEIHKKDIVEIISNFEQQKIKI